nr:hypothetical protein [Tanacetum cinerariifolium]
TRSERVSKLSNDSLLTRGNTLQSDEDSIKLNELMELCTTLQSRVLDLEPTKTTQANKIHSLTSKVKKLEKKQRSRAHKLKRLYKVGLTARVESSDDEQSLGDDASEQGRISDIDAYKGITIVSTHDDAEMFDVDKDLHGEEGRISDIDAYKGIAIVSTHDDAEMFDADKDLHGEEVFVAKQDENVVEKEVNAAQVQLKKKDQIMLDEEVTLKLQAEFDKEQRLTREKAQKELEANIALIETWDDVQARIDADYQLAERLQAEEQ